MPDFDVITVGAGHNALITSAYLAQAGYKVGVFERRDIVGGAVSTKEIVPGYQFDLGGSAHILIRLTPIVEELGLEHYGLEYIDIDPLFFAPYDDGESVFIYRSEQETIDGLERTYPGEGEAYGRFMDDWRPFGQAVKELFLSTPSPLNLGKKMIFGKAIKGDWKQALSKILKPYGEVVDSYFKEERVKTPLVWMAAQSGPPPSRTVFVAVRALATLVPRGRDGAAQGRFGDADAGVGAAYRGARRANFYGRAGREDSGRGNAGDGHRGRRTGLYGPHRRCRDARFRDFR